MFVSCVQGTSRSLFLCVARRNSLLLVGGNFSGIDRCAHDLCVLNQRVPHRVIRSRVTFLAVAVVRQLVWCLRQLCLARREAPRATSVLFGWLGHHFGDLFLAAVSLGRLNHRLLQGGYGFVSYLCFGILRTAEACKFVIRSIKLATWFLSTASRGTLFLLHFLNKILVSFGSIVRNDIFIHFSTAQLRMWIAKSLRHYVCSCPGSRWMPLLPHFVKFVGDGTILGKYAGNLALRAVWRVVWECFKVLLQVELRRRRKTKGAAYTSCCLKESAIVKGDTWVAQSALLADLEEFCVAILELVELVIVLAIHHNLLRHSVASRVFEMARAIQVLGHSDVVKSLLQLFCRLLGPNLLGCNGRSALRTIQN